MDDLIRQILRLLQEEAARLREFLNLLHRERDAAIRVEFFELHQVGKLKEEVVGHLRHLESRRRSSLIELAARLDIPAETVTLQELAQRMGEPHSQRLTQRRSELLALIQSVQEVNRQNRALLAHAIELLKGSYRLLDELTAESPVYARTGGISAKESLGKLFSGQV